MRTLPNQLEQHRTPTVVARVPKAPLFTLFVLNLIYAVVGIGVAVFATLSSDVKGGAGAIRQRLTIPGLVAECF